MENKKIISHLSFTSLILIIVTYSSLTLTLISNPTFFYHQRIKTKTQSYFHVSTISIQLNYSLLSFFAFCPLIQLGFRLGCRVLFLFLVRLRSKLALVHTLYDHDLISSGSRIVGQ